MAFNQDTARQAGRKSSRRGVQNRATSDLRQAVADLLERNATAIVKDLEALEPKDRVNAWIRLLEFSLPKLNRTEAEISADTSAAPMQVHIVFTEDDLKSDPIE